MSCTHTQINFVHMQEVIIIHKNYHAVNGGWTDWLDHGLCKASTSVGIQTSIGKVCLDQVFNAVHRAVTLWKWSKEVLQNMQ